MSQWPELDRLDPEVVKRYDQRGPRYTSYPTAPHFADAFDREALLGRLRATSARDAPASLSNYLHVPYCQNKCLYFGCHSVAIGSPDEPASYAETLHRELAARSSPVGVTVLCPAFFPTGITDSERVRPPELASPGGLSADAAAAQVRMEKAVRSGRLGADDVARLALEEL